MTESSLSLPHTPPTLETVASRHDANPGGDIFGGWIMSQMDLVGGTRAYAYVGGRVVTAGVTDISFKKPLFVGDCLRFYTSIEQIGRTSITVRVDLWRGSRERPEFDHVASGLYTFVLIDENYRPKEIIPSQHERDAA